MAARPRSAMARGSPSTTCGSPPTAPWTRPTPRSAWRACTPAPPPMRCWRASRTICSISARISAGRATIRTTAGLRVQPSQVERLEQEIDALNASLKPLDSFVLPGGTAASAYLHLARTIVRRAERLTTQLAGEQPVNRCAIHYLNRLSDHLFVLARYLNDGGAADVLWVPGANRDDLSTAVEVGRSPAVDGAHRRCDARSHTSQGGCHEGGCQRAGACGGDGDSGRAGRDTSLDAGDGDEHRRHHLARSGRDLRADRRRGERQRLRPDHGLRARRGGAVRRRRRELGHRRRRPHHHPAYAARPDLPFRQSGHGRRRGVLAEPGDQAEQDAGVHLHPVRLDAREHRSDGHRDRRHDGPAEDSREPGADPGAELSRRRRRVGGRPEGRHGARGRRRPRLRAG